MDRQKSFSEVVGTEKQMLALIYSKGILHDDVLELYDKIRIGYKKILLDSNQMVQLQEAEYHIWKLHYQLIDEFRKRIKQRSYNAENMKNGAPLDNVNPQSNTDKGLERFKSFLSEATEFYRKLIVELRTNCGLPGEIFLNKKECTSFSVESTRLHACQHTCHRLLVCLGDLARYTETVKKSGASDWSTAATYYLEATRTWPDSGNPHNQLALLATYVGDPFLALYHCVRSLAVKEPFPDAWRNIMLLFEENRSTKLQSLSNQMELDFLNPSKRTYSQNEENNSLCNSKLEDLETGVFEMSDLWPILVRTTSFFLIRPSLEEFPCTLASALGSLESILAVDDTKLTIILESYQKMDSSRRGPYRAIQLVSVFIFIVHILTESPEREESTGKDARKHSVLTPLAFAATFTCMGRLTERCLKGNHRDSCSLLPAVLVFLEWLVGALDTVEAYDADARVMKALSYFLAALADLLDRIEQNGTGNALDYTALWEDHELRGFYPLNRVHEMLDFATHLDCADDYNSRKQCRSRRIFDAAKTIMGTTKSSREWIPHGRVGRLLDLAKMTKVLDQGEGETAASVSSHKAKGPDEPTDKSSRNKEKLPERAVSFSAPKTEPSTEEEEVILFKPITRHNSAPVYISQPAKDSVGPEGAQIQTTVTDEWLRRATSLSTGQNIEDIDSFSFCSTTSNSGHKRPLKEKEPQLKDSTTHPARPPSLSAWVVSQGSSNVEREEGLNDFNKQKLCTIEEMTSASFSDLSINETKDSQVGTGHTSTIIHESSPFVTPMPSAPLLPDDAAWLRGNSLISPEFKSTVGTEADGILGAAPISSYTSRSTVRPPMGLVPGLTGLVDGYPPLLGMSSSEWLYHYRNSQNMPGNHTSPVHLNAPVYGNFLQNELSGFDLCDQWGNRLVSHPMLYLGSPQHYPSSSVYGAEEQKRDKYFLGYQRPFPYVCGVGTELSSEQPPLLQYLKEKERQLQPGSQLRNPTFMGN